MAEEPQGHPRKLIRAALKALFEAAEIVPNGHVFKSRTRPVKLPELPIIAIYTTDEQVDDDSKETSPTILRRTPGVAVEVMVRAVDDADDVLDDLCQGVEDAVAADPTLGGLVVRAILDGTQIDLWTEAGQLLYVSATLTFDIEYDSAWPRQSAELDEFNNVQSTLNLGGGQHADNQQVTQFAVQEPEEQPEP